LTQEREEKRQTFFEWKDPEGRCDRAEAWGKSPPPRQKVKGRKGLEYPQKGKDVMGTEEADINGGGTQRMKSFATVGCKTEKKSNGPSSRKGPGALRRKGGDWGQGPWEKRGPRLPRAKRLYLGRKLRGEESSSPTETPRRGEKDTNWEGGGAT